MRAEGWPSTTSACRTPAAVRPSRALKARWSTTTSSGRTRSTTRCTSRATPRGFQSRSSRRARAWYSRVSTAPWRVASKNPRRASSSPRGWSSARITPGLEPRPSWRSRALEPEAAHDAVGGRAGGHHHALARVTPRRRQGGQRVQVRGVVGADHQQRHEATSWCSRSKTWLATRRLPPGRRDPAVDAVERRGHRVDPEPVAQQRPGLVGPLGAPRVVGERQRARDGIRERVGRGRVDEHPGQVLLHVGRRSAAGGCHDDQARRHRLDDRDAELLLEAGRDVDPVRGGEAGSAEPRRGHPHRDDRVGAVTGQQQAPAPRPPTAAPLRGCGRAREPRRRWASRGHRRRRAGCSARRARGGRPTSRPGSPSP